MATKLHLRVFQTIVDSDIEPSQVHLWHVQRTEFVWNETFTAFRPVALRWWDDASYIVAELFGGPDMDDRYDDEGPQGASPTVVAPVAPTPVAPPGWADDEIPF